MKLFTAHLSDFRSKMLDLKKECLNSSSPTSKIQHKKSRLGFTLIELLVVIGILGILAAALIATIDPFEQLNKAQDSNSKNTSVEFLNATIRYYTTHSAMPWASTGAGCNSTALPSASNLSGMEDCMTTLVAEGELKSAFTTASGILSGLFVTADSSNNVTMCYMPKSKSQQKDPNTKFNADGTLYSGGTCKSAGGTADCYWCTQ